MPTFTFDVKTKSAQKRLTLDAESLSEAVQKLRAQLGDEEVGASWTYLPEAALAKEGK